LGGELVLPAWESEIGVSFGFAISDFAAEVLCGSKPKGEWDVACRWQIRHKLMIGLGLVIGVLSLVLVGTLHGLAAYRATTNSVDSKLVELHEAQALKAAMNYLVTTPVPDGVNEREFLLEKCGFVHQALEAYQARLQDTLQRRRDPDKGRDEREIIEDFEKELALLEQTIRAQPEVTVGSNMPTERLRNNPVISEGIKKLDLASIDLQDAIYKDMYRRIGEAKSDYRASLSIVLSTSIIGVLLMLGLLRFFYRWTFSPIRDLQQGVARVAEGDFEHRIEVHSGDEMETLANAFNNMTGRLRDMYHDLARQVNERSRQLIRSERLASVGFLAAGVAHEINNPLASIAFCSEALERRLFGNVARKPRLAEMTLKQLRATDSGSSLVINQADEEVVTKYLKMIQDEAFRCKKITERLLEFSRGGDHRREPTDLGELIQSVLDVVQHLENSRGKQIVFAPTGPLLAWVNAQEIKSVVLNLVVNALESMDEGGTLTISLERCGRMAEMIFTDTGCGMEAEVLENIFEPFFTRSRTGKGTGLGLSISHRVITQHGGEIEATSSGSKQGSTFTVRLPLKPAEPVKEEPLSQAA
jgi:signal transduction histidine kinase